MAVPSPLGDVKYSVHNYHFRAKYIDTQINCIFFLGGGGGRGGNETAWRAEGPEFDCRQNLSFFAFFFLFLYV